MFEDKNLCSISTSQPIPEGIKSYGFEIELSKCSNNALIAFGMKSDVDEIRYWSKDGVVESNGDYIETIDTYDQGAVVRCHFRQINYAGTALQQCEFMCNEKNLGAWWIEGKHLRPTIWFDPMDEAFEMAEVKTKFDTNKQQCNLGNYISIFQCGILKFVRDINNIFKLKIRNYCLTYFQFLNYKLLKSLQAYYLGHKRSPKVFLNVKACAYRLLTLYQINFPLPCLLHNLFLKSFPHLHSRLKLSKVVS